MEVPPVLLDRGSAMPLSVQLADGLRTAASEGTLRPGDRLPSTRELAHALGVSRTVTAPPTTSCSPRGGRRAATAWAPSWWADRPRHRVRRPPARWSARAPGRVWT